MDNLDPRTWLEECKKLAIGQTKRLPHDCGPGSTLFIQHKPKGWDAWCHRCNQKGWVPHPPESLHEKIERLRPLARADEVARENPHDVPLPKVSNPADWPVAARVWLYKAGMTDNEIRANGFYYHERTKRVVLPIVQDGRVVYWQARGFDPDRPKYLNPRVDKNELLVRFRGVGGTNGGSAGTAVVLCEDILSAWKVANRGGVDAWCLLGTNLPDTAFREALERGLRVYVWLDPDAAGIRGATKAIRRLRGYGVMVSRIVSDKDPKLLQGHSIRSLLT